MQHEKAYLLSYIKYKDTDAVLHCFSEENGFKSFFLRGIYSPKNKKKAYLQPLNELSIFINEKSGTGLRQISRIEILKNIELENIRQNAIIFFVADFLNQVLNNESNSKLIYQKIKTLISEIENHNHSSHLIFLILLLKDFGFAPLISEEIFLNPETGTFTDQLSQKLFTQEISDIWKQTLTDTEPFKIIIEPKKRPELLESIMLYYQLHFSGFRIPKSLETLRQLW